MLKEVQDMKTIKNNLVMLKYVFKYIPVYAVFSIIYIGISVFSVYYGVLFIEQLSSVLINPNAMLYDIVRITIIYMIIIASMTIINGMYWTWFGPRFRLTYTKKMQRLMYEKALTMNIEYYDEPTKYDQFSRALKETDIRAIGSFDTITGLIHQVVQAITLTFYIVTKLPLLFGVILIGAILTLLTSNKLNKRRYRIYKELEKNWRNQSYISRAFYLDKNACDIKTTNLSKLLLKKNLQLFNVEDNTWRKYENFRYKYNVLENVIYNIIVSFFAYGYLMYQVYQDPTTLSMFVATAAAVSIFINTFWAISNYIVRLNDNARYIGDLLWLLNFKPELELDKGERVESMHPTVRINNLSFRYPNQEINVLNNINLIIKPHEKIAIIGYNGAGKTTLVKLLLKFYLPNIGDIRLDDKNYIDLSSFNIRNKFALTFQNFQIYAVSVLENILMRRKESEEDELQVWELLDKVGLKTKILELKEGINTLLTKEFTNEGLELSGGERQRLAIARALASNAPIIIFDEPTSCLDPIAEAQINKIILAESGRRSVIIISHRLSTIVDVDCIYLMKEGSIVETGTHKQLMDLRKEYYTMFETQAKYYKNN